MSSTGNVEDQCDVGLKLSDQSPTAWQPQSSSGVETPFSYRAVIEDSEDSRGLSRRHRWTPLLGADIIQGQRSAKQSNPKPAPSKEKALPLRKKEVKPELDRMRHSAAHLMAAAVQDLWPEAKFGVGPTTKDGFYYDIDLPVPLGLADLEKVEAKMGELRKKGLTFERTEVPIDEAIAEMERLGQPYKVELLKLLKEKGTTQIVKEFGDEGVADGNAEAGATQVSFYRTGGFLDLCRGPHVGNTREIGPFKLLKVAGAYWRGDEKNQQLQRVYGAAFSTKEELAKHLWQLEESKKRDHRKLGKELEIFFISEEVGPGLPLWLPNGVAMRKELEKLATEEERKDGYTPVATPVITKEQLYYQSGHLPYYKDDMYAPLQIDNENYYLRPMNCPHHHMVYGVRPRSYRELPVRLSEYGLCYRYEASGVLSGLMRVRSFCMNDAHLYCTYDQAKEEFIRVMHLHARYYKLFDIKDYYMSFSLPDLNRLDKYVDQPQKWLTAMDIIRQAMDETDYPYEEHEGDAAFYGPKIDFIIENVIGNEYAISTNQLDFLASERFNLTYIGADSKEYPIYVIHRAPLGSHERFIAFLIEHYAGNFPTWLAPTQVQVIPITDRHNDYAMKIKDILFTAPVATATGGLRVETDLSSERMQKKIRNATLMKIPYMIVVGDKEMEAGQVAVRHRSGRDMGTMPIEQLIERLRTEITARRDLE
jgi:threonyl-tRNA synthetase